MKNKFLDIFLSFYIIIRYIAISILIYLVIGAYTVNSYGVLILIYYVAVNYIAVKYGIIKEFNRRNDLCKKDFFLLLSCLLLGFNLLLFSQLQGFETYEVLIISIIPVIEFYLIKTNKEKKEIVDINTKKTIDEYFKNKK